VGSRVGLVVVLTLCTACSACAGRDATPRRGDLYSARSGYARGLLGARLRPDAPSLSEVGGTRASRAGPAYDAGAYGPEGTAGDDYVPFDDAPCTPSPGSCPPSGAEFQGPSGAVPPGLRSAGESDARLEPASPYRGPTDPPDAFRRPGTAAGNDTYPRR
jgi:hypothetical protein